MWTYDNPDCPKTDKHCELDRAQIQKFEKAVVLTISAICNFTHPFTTREKDHLYNVASGAAVSTNVKWNMIQPATAQKEAFNGGRLKIDSEKIAFELIRKKP